MLTKQLTSFGAILTTGPGVANVLSVVHSSYRNGRDIPYFA